MLGGDLSKATLPAIFGPNQLVIQFSAEYNQQYVNCSDSSRLNRIQDAVRQLTGEPWVVRIEQVVPKNRPIVDIPPANAMHAELEIDPMVQAVQSALDARLLKIDDGFGRPAAETDSNDSDLSPSETEDE
jgi:hypothetical protein